MEPKKRSAETTIKGRCDSYAPGGQQTKNLRLKPKVRSQPSMKVVRNRGVCNYQGKIGENILIKKVPQEPHLRKLG